MKAPIATIPPRPMTASSWALGTTVTVLVATTIGGFFLLDAGSIDVGASVQKAFHDLAAMFFQPQAQHFTVTDLLVGLVFTLALGLLTTVFGAVPALLLAFFAARNLAPRWLSIALRSFVAVIRAVPTVLWVLIFAIGAGLGSVAAVVGMTFHSFGYLLKAYSESFEEIDMGSVEAIRSTGANAIQVATNSILPASMGSIVSWTFLRFEINFTTAVAMGAAAGAGGIGFELFMSASYYVNIREVGTITWMILLVAIVLELGALRLKRIHKYET